MKDPEKGTSSWIIQVGPCQKEAGGDFAHRRKWCEPGAERELKMPALKVRAMSPQAKECWQPPEAGGGRDKLSLADTLIWAYGY